MKTLVTGATGLIGQHLIRRLPASRVLARDPARALATLGVADALAWESGRPLPEGALTGVDTVFHLAGEPIAKGRLTAARKRQIRDSRVLGTRSVVTAIREAAVRPKVLVSGSAIGFYGSRGSEVLTEESGQGSGFLADICAEWEAEAREAEPLGVRVVCVRTAIVLAREGGALAEMARPFKLGVGGPLGSGEQWMSWIHIDDLVGLLVHAAARPDVQGALNGAAPEPVTNNDFARALGRAMHRPAFVRTPAVALRLALGEMADVIMASQRVSPAKARATGYAFRFEALAAALRDLFSAGW